MSGTSLSHYTSHDSWLFGRLFQSWRLLASWTSDVEGRFHWSFTGGSNSAAGKGLTELGPWHLQMLIGTGPIVPPFVYPSHHVGSLLVVGFVAGFPRSTFAKRSSLDLSLFEAPWLRRGRCSCRLLPDARCGSSIDAQPTEKIFQH